MSEKKVIILLGCVIVFIAVYVLVLVMQNYGLRRDSGTTTHALRVANRQIQQSRDSIQSLEATVEVLKMSMAHKVTELRDSVKQEQAATLKWKQTYEASKKYRVPASVSDAGLDSLITDLIRQPKNN